MRKDKLRDKSVITVEDSLYGHEIVCRDVFLLHLAHVLVLASLADSTVIKLEIQAPDTVSVSFSCNLAHHMGAVVGLVRQLFITRDRCSACDLLEGILREDMDAPFGADFCLQELNLIKRFLLPVFKLFDLLSG